MIAVPLAAVAIALGFAIAADGGERSDSQPLTGSGSTVSIARPPGSGPTVSVSLAGATAGAPVPRAFLGLSFEMSSAALIATYAQRGDFVRMLRSLGPGVLRLGGASADSRVAWSDTRTPRPQWASSVIGAADLRGLRKLAAASGWHILWTIGLAHYDATAASREAAAVRRILGPWLAGIEIGNEPDSYGHHALRLLPWTAAQYEHEVSAYRRAIARRAPGIPVAGPGVSGSRAFKRWGAAEAHRQHPSLLTGHHYPLRCDSVPPPTVPDLLSGRIRVLEALSLQRYISVARKHDTPFRMDETNTVSCGGRPGVSDTFASALWAASYIAQTAVAGAAGINLQGAPANCRGYSPVCAPSSEQLALGALQAQPEWYGLLLMRSLVGYRPLRPRVLAPANANLEIAALRGTHGSLKFLIVDDEPTGMPAATVRLHVGAAAGRASVLRLTAPSAEARSGVRLGGRPVQRDGSWHPGRNETLSAGGGVLALSVAASSAALVTVAGH